MVIGYFLLLKQSAASYKNALERHTLIKGCADSAAFPFYLSLKKFLFAMFVTRLEYKYGLA